MLYKNKKIFVTFKNKLGNKIILGGNYHNVEAFTFKTHLTYKQKIIYIIKAVLGDDLIHIIGLP